MQHSSAQRFAADQPRAAAQGEGQKASARILALNLLTTSPLATLKDFYQRLLGLPVVVEAANRLTIAAGETLLTFAAVDDIDSQPFYHFAFNIPENKIEAAWHWQKERSALIPIPARLQDPKFPVDVVNYSHWNAHSLYFFDPAGNVVEYIARHDLKNSAPGHFTPDDILCASEIAFVTDDVPALATILKDFAGVQQYRGGDDQFMALGDEQGLLLVMKSGRVISFDAPVKKAVTVFATGAKVRGKRPGRHHLAGHPFEVTMESAQ